MFGVDFEVVDTRAKIEIPKGEALVEGDKVPTLSLEERKKERVKKHLGNGRVGIKCTDHLGNEFESIRGMCRRWGVSVPVYASRLKRGFDLETALTSKRASVVGVKYTDHLGVEYESKAEMCRAWGITLSAYDSRNSRGLSIEEILTTKKKPSRCVESKDHLGNVYQSRAEMCRAYGVRYTVYLARKAAGWSLESCLTRGMVRKRNRKMED